MTDQELADIHSQGTTDFGKVRLVMQGDRYAIFRWPGGPWWDNGGRHYGQVSYCLALKGAPCHGRDRRPVLKEWWGRVPKKELQKALAEAEVSD
jgi:hypothetical protein